MKILMTDDDSDDRMLAMLAFKSLNLAHSIDFVTNGVELLDYLHTRVSTKRELPDLILLDLNMPLKDGREALMEIKADNALKHLEVIIFSTSSSENDKQSTLSMGAKNYIVKPPNQDDLIMIFKNLCQDLEAVPGWRYAIKQ
jgi:CheY-like chemotaxis protein